MWAQSSFVLSHRTRLTEIQTDKRTDRKVLSIPCVVFHAASVSTNIYNLVFKPVHS